MSTTLTLTEKFPLLNSNMTLVEEVRTVNDIRLGMFTNSMNITDINRNLDELLPNLSDDEVCNLLQNLSMAYAKAKVWGEKIRKTKIALDVNEVETAKLIKAQEKRQKKEKKAEEVNSSISNSNLTKVPKAEKVASLQYDSDPAVNKAIKEMISVTKSYPLAIGMLKSIGALPESYQIQEKI